MNIAYLILAHNQPEQLFRLYNKLHQQNSFFYIHIDEKSVNKSDFFDFFRDKENVKIISEYSIYWMGFNMVAGTLALLKQAYASEHKYKYFVLLSGQDYPIKSNTYINDFFTNHSCDFIDYNKISHLSPDFKKKYTLYHYYDMPYTNPRSSKKIPALVKLYYYTKKAEHKLLPERKFYKGMVPWFGPQWFALTNGTVKYVLDFINDNKSYLSFMKYTEGPDETFFQTIICNSELRTNLYHYDKYLAWEKTKKQDEYFINPLACIEFMDWSERGKPKPATLNMDYLEEIKKTDFIFARKFDQNESGELMQKIDEEILLKQI